MKKTVIFGLKLALLLLFLWNINLFSFLSKMEPSHETKYPQKTQAGRLADIKFLADKVARAKKLGSNYGPEEYFADLTEIRLKEKTGDFDRMVVISIQNNISQLLGIFSNNIKNRERNKNQSEYDKYMVRLDNARDKHQEVLEPGITARQKASEQEMEAPGYWSGLALSILNWLWHFYCRNLLLALGLIWIWWYQEKGRIAINNPLGFLLCVVFYPIVIIRTWRRKLNDWTKEQAMKVEFKRRQSDVFSLISDDELADIKRYASSMKLSDYRKYLDNRGFIRQHSFGIALTALVLSSALPAQASQIDTGQSQLTEYQQSNLAPPGINLDYDLPPAIMPDEYIIFISSSIISWISLSSPDCSPGFLQRPGPIPLFV